MTCQQSPSCALNSDPVAMLAAHCFHGRPATWSAVSETMQKAVTPASFSTFSLSPSPDMSHAMLWSKRLCLHRWLWSWTMQLAATRYELVPSIARFRRTGQWRALCCQLMNFYLPKSAFNVHQVCLSRRWCLQISRACWARSDVTHLSLQLSLWSCLNLTECF